MEHIALYRQFRPQTFDDIVEQETAVTTLRQTVISGKIGHAYLFCGTRGTGKTTIAKVFSRAINCEHPINGNPCNECPTCKGILESTLMDVIEIDAASNNSVDNVRKICEEVVYAPSKAPFKVYIIDEVHMLSSGAFNALLKTLEEPPKHAVFLLATTEPHKIPATILSRCQRFDFKRISLDAITKRLAYICSKESIPADDEALKLIATLADGALRDSISLLDQAQSAASILPNGNKKTITAQSIEEITGIVDTKFLFNMASTLIKGDYEKLLPLCDELFKSGRDLTRFAIDLGGYFRDLLVVRMMPDPTGLVTASATTLKAMYTLAATCSAETLVAFISYISNLVSELKWSPSIRTTFEISLLRLCGRKVKTDIPPLVIPDFVKKQAKAAEEISAKMAEETSSPAIEEKPKEEVKNDVKSLFSKQLKSEPTPEEPKVEKDSQTESASDTKLSEEVKTEVKPEIKTEEKTEKESETKPEEKPSTTSSEKEVKSPFSFTSPLLGINKPSIFNTSASVTSEDKKDEAKESSPSASPVESKPDTSDEIKPEVKTEEKEEKPEVKSETNAEAAPETKTEAKQEVKPEVKAEDKPDTKPEAKPEVKAEPEEKKSFVEAMLSNPDIPDEEKPNENQMDLFSMSGITETKPSNKAERKSKLSSFSSGTSLFSSAIKMEEPKKNDSSSKKSEESVMTLEEVKPEPKPQRRSMIADVYESTKDLPEFKTPVIEEPEVTEEISSEPESPADINAIWSGVIKTFEDEDYPYYLQVSAADIRVTGNKFYIVFNNMDGSAVKELIALNSCKKMRDKLKIVLPDYSFYMCTGEQYNQFVNKKAVNNPESSKAAPEDKGSGNTLFADYVNKKTNEEGMQSTLDFGEDW
ncbi:MAG: DNA polymerase III subunit gamma/tau [Clostridia bacterium]|nr:DNA polymerase III subunit gamma/tau [Clostridia bacterium]